MSVLVMKKRLFHFSDNPAIEVFEPRPVRVPAPRPKGMGWLNGPLIWAIDDAHSPLYLFPRDCPRIIMWRTPETSAVDAARFLEPTARMTAYVERKWATHIEETILFRYELPTGPFADLNNAGLHVAHIRVKPLSCERLSNLTSQLAIARVKLRTVASLTPLRDAWNSSLHVSGIRLRNAIGWVKEQ